MPVSIEIGPDNRIWADIPWAGGSGPRKAKQVAGVRPKYEKSKKAGVKDKFLAWTYPLDMNSCRQLRQVFGHELKVGPQLVDWAKVAIAHEEEMIALAKSDGKDLELPLALAPVLAKAMDNRPYQKVAAQFAAQGRNTIIGDHPGLGKTLETLAALAMDPGVRRIVVFAPSTAMESVWAREIKRWTTFDVCVADGSPTRRVAAIQDVTMPKSDPARPRILICNPEMIRTKREVDCPVCGGVEPDECPSKGKAIHVTFLEHKYPELFAFEWDAAVIDECHKSLIGKNVMAKKVSQTRLGMMLLPVAKDGLKIALSGTPYRGKPELLWGVMNWLRPDVFTSFWRWVETFFEVHKGYNDSRIIGEMREDRLEAYDRMLAPYLLRRTKAEVASDLPPKMYGGTPLDPADETSPIAVWLEMEPAQAKQYQQMAEESEAQLDSGVIEAIGTLPEMTRLKQFSICSWDKGVTGMTPKPLPSNKYEWLKQFLTERQEEGGKVVVASQYTKVINAFGRQLHEDGFSCVTLTGETKQKDRAGMVDRFQTDPDLQVFLINTSAGGVAITLDAADDLVFLDETYIPDDQEQVEDRIHRVSRIHQVTIWKLLSLGTIEEAIARTTEYREGIVKERLDGSRGVQWVKQLLKGGKR
jgi:SNF2 family DNA or RNA helicase